MFLLEALQVKSRFDPTVSSTDEEVNYTLSTKSILANDFQNLEV